jgi:hypothetical protein
MAQNWNYIPGDSGFRDLGKYHHQQESSKAFSGLGRGPTFELGCYETV